LLTAISAIKSVIKNPPKKPLLNVNVLFTIS
jgi:hypothetical protein